MDLEQYFEAMAPELRPVFRSRQGQPLVPLETPAAPPPVSDSVAIEDRFVPGPKGAPRVPVRLYAPKQRGSVLPALLWIHGGGFTGGTIAQNDGFCLRVAEQVGCLVVSVGYRLAPQHPFPAGPEDCYAALRWLATSAGELRVDTARIAVGGSSAGGCLAASVALMARDRREIKLAFQLLVYPCLDDRNATPSTHEIAADGMIWNRAQSLHGWRQYLGPAHVGEPPLYAAPARAADLAGLPPTYVMAAQLDLLRDEDIEYATRLMQAGVPTELHVHPGAIHGFVLFAPSAAVSERAISDYIRALRVALNP